MSFRIGRKFSKKFLKNIEKTYKTYSNEEDIYHTYSPNNKNNNKMTTDKNNQSETLTTINNDNNMEDIITTTAQEIPSNSRQKEKSHDTNINDQPIQTPINSQ